MGATHDYEALYVSGARMPAGLPLADRKVGGGWGVVWLEGRRAHLAVAVGSSFLFYGG